MVARGTPTWAIPLIEKIEAHDAMLAIHKELHESHQKLHEKAAERLTTLESIYGDVADIRHFAKRTWQAMKVMAPTVIGGLTAAGWVNGDIARVAQYFFGIG